MTSFIFITSMLLRIIGEIISSMTEDAAKHTFRRHLEGSYATVFSEAIIIKAPLPSNNAKERRASQARRKRVVEVFLHQADS